jgi:hypothetical protein
MKRIIQRQCPSCHKDQRVEVEDIDYTRYINGEGYVQTIFPYLTTSQRETLLSGICDTCWDETFKEDEDENL